MRKEAADEWIAALRSGDYKQATGNLVKFNPNDPADRSHCCLGVQCELAVRHGVIDRGADNLVYYHGTYDVGETSELPGAVEDWAEFETDGPMVDATIDDPEYGERTIHVSLIDLNDVHGFTFEQIADLIEEQWEDM